MSGRPPLDKDLHFVDVHVGARLRWRREQRGVSQKRLAKTLRRLFPAHPQIRERPQRISPSRLYRFARHLDVRVAWFFEGLPAGRDAPARAKTTRFSAPLAKADGLTHGLKITIPFAWATCSEVIWSEYSRSQ